MSNKNKKLVLSDDSIRTIIREELVISQSENINENTGGNSNCNAARSGRDYMSSPGVSWSSARGFYGCPIGQNRRGEDVIDLGWADSEHIRIFPGDGHGGRDDDFNWRETAIEDGILPVALNYMSANNTWTNQRSTPVGDVNQTSTRIIGFLNADTYQATLEAAAEVWGNIDDDILENNGLPFTGKDVLDYIQNPEGAGVSGAAGYLGWSLANKPIIGLSAAAKVSFKPGVVRGSSTSNSTPRGKFRMACEQQVQRWQSCQKPNAFPEWFLDSWGSGVDIRGTYEEIASADGTAATQMILDRMTVVAFEGPDGGVILFPASEFEADVARGYAGPARYWNACSRFMDAIIAEVNKGADMSPRILYVNFKQLIFADRSANLITLQAALGACSARARAVMGGSAAQFWSKTDWAIFGATMLFGPALLMGTARALGIGCRIQALTAVRYAGTTSSGAARAGGTIRILGPTGGTSVPINAGDKVLLASGRTAADLTLGGAGTVNFTRGAQAAARIRRANTMSADDATELLALEIQAAGRAAGTPGVEALTAEQVRRLAQLKSSRQTVAAAEARAAAFEAAGSSCDNIISVAMAQLQMVGARGGSGRAALTWFGRDTMTTIRTYFPYAPAATWTAGQAGRALVQTFGTLGVSAWAAGRVLTGDWGWFGETWAYHRAQAIFDQMPDDYKDGLFDSDSKALSNFLFQKADETPNPQAINNIGLCCEMIAEAARNPDERVTRMALIQRLENGISWGNMSGQIPARYEMDQDERQFIQALEDGEIVDGPGAVSALEDRETDSLREATGGEVLNALCQGDIAEQYSQILNGPQSNFWRNQHRHLGMTQTERSLRQRNLERVVEDKIEAAGGSLTTSAGGNQYTLTLNNFSPLPMWLQTGDDSSNTLYDSDADAAAIVAGTSLPESAAAVNFSMIWFQNSIDTGPAGSGLPGAPPATP